MGKIEAEVPGFKSLFFWGGGGGGGGAPKSLTVVWMRWESVKEEL